MHLALHLLRLVRALTRDRTRLALENMALCQQLAVLQRTVERPTLKDSDRLVWSMACEFLDNWKDHLVIVKPDTVIRWLCLPKSHPHSDSAACWRTFDFSVTPRLARRRRDRDAPACVSHCSC